MKTLTFTTNINCSGCVAKVTPHLDANDGIKEWKVDIDDPKKILTVKTTTLNESEVKAIVGMAGFRAEKVI